MDASNGHVLSHIPTSSTSAVHNGKEGERNEIRREPTACA